MASGSLGRLTLDLAVRLSEFTDGLSRAERATRERTDQMGKSTKAFKDQLINDLGGTPIGGAIATLTDKLGTITKAFGEGGISGAAKIGAASVAASLVAMGAGLVALSIKTANADEELQRLAQRAGATTKEMQVLSAAAGNYGKSMGGVSNALQAAQRRFGKFSASGGGGLVDTLKLLQKSTGMADAELEKFGKSLSTVGTVDAIQMVYDELEKAGATSEEVVFVTSSLSRGLVDLIPMWDNNGEAIKDYEKQLEQAGVIRTKESIEQSAKLAAQMEVTKIQMEGVKNQLVTNTLPALSGLIDYMSKSTDGSKGLSKELSGVGYIANSAGSFIIGLSTVFKSFGYVIAGVGASLSSFFGLIANVVKSPFGIIDHVKSYLAETGAIGNFMVEDIHNAAMSGGSAINSIWNPTSAGLGASGAVDERLSAALDDNTEAVGASTKASATASKKAELLREAVFGGKKFGISPGGGFGGARGHNGIDLLAPSRTQVYAPESGVIQAYGGNTSRGGKQMRLITSDGKVYGFAHLDSFDVPSGTEVAAGMGIAKTGNTGTRPNGKGYGNHLHLTVTANGKKIDPKNVKVRGDGVKYDATVGAANSKAERERAQAQAKADAESLRQQQDLQRRKLSVASRWATEREKIESDHIANVTEIEFLHAEGSADRAKYLAREKSEYMDKRTAAARSMLESYMEGEERLTYEHNEKIREINAKSVEGDPTRQMLVDLQNAAYQKDLENFRFAANAKVRAQDEMYQSIANSMKGNQSQSANYGLDRMAQRTMSGEDYQVWRLAQDHDESYDSVNNQYASRQAEINDTDERGDFLLPKLERDELLEIANQEHLDKMWAMEQDFALKDQTLAEQQSAQRVAVYQSMFAGMTNAASVFFGESSRMHKVAFAIEKGYAVHKALMNVETTRSNTFDALSAIPIIGPYIAGPGAVVAAALQVATASGIQGMSAPSVSGIAHGGLEYVPSESTYLLDKGERVLSPNQNKDFTNFLAKGNDRSGGITINDYSSAEVSATRNSNGEVTIEIVDKMIEKSFRRIGHANSIESKSIQRNTTARVNRS